MMMDGGRSSASALGRGEMIGGFAASCWTTEKPRQYLPTLAKTRRGLKERSKKGLVFEFMEYCGWQALESGCCAVRSGGFGC
ncbi:unnamed protein product [Hapterophycus canaliculatus]